MPPENGRRVYRFGVFEADGAAGELRKRGVRIKLHSQPFQVLLMLLEKPFVIVTREEMRQGLWGNDTFVDFDHSLNTAVSKIRDVLGDSASVPRYVETIAGKGYRFLAPVTTQTDIPERPTPPLAEPEPRAAIPALLTIPLLTTPAELPVIPGRLVRTLLLLIQTMYLGFYFGALGI
ncbi:MAG TPA: winged helix-turn-helix domain-containing protein [Bryobacteraceae bacterium]